jgi:hypothetical protein
MPPNVRTRSHISPIGRKQLLDGVIVPKKPDVIEDDYNRLLSSAWYQTANYTPFLYLPPACVIDELENGMKLPHYSLDVLIAVHTLGNALIVLSGFFNFAIYEWAYYGVDPRFYDDYTPHFWRFMPDLPLGWLDNAPANVPIPESG